MRATTAPDQLYEADFYAWTRQQALALRRFARTRPNLPLDLEHIAEEIQDLGKSERDTVYSLARQIMQHLLLIEHSPATEQRRHWMDEIDEFRAQVKRKLSPTIRRYLKRDLGEVYGDGRRIVERKMGRYGEQEATAGLPAHCPYTVEQVLGDWLPETEARTS
jgi:hypothetical protein